MLRENGFRLLYSIGKNSKRSDHYKVCKKFIDDASYSNLENAMTQNNAEEAFRAVHTLKGICLNLGFDTLYKASFELTEKLRDGHIDGSKEAYEAVKAAYGLTVNAIKELDV